MPKVKMELPKDLVDWVFVLVMAGTALAAWVWLGVGAYLFLSGCW